MDNQETLLEEEVETDVDTDLGDDSDSGFDFGLDEDGDVPIPEEAEEGDNEGEENTDVSESEAEEEEPPAEEAKEEPAPAKSAREAELEKQVAALLKKNGLLEAVGRDALKKLNVSGDDVLAGLASLAAEEGVTPEQYLKKHEDSEKNEENRRFVESVKYEAMFAADIKALHEAYPETKQYKSVRELPDSIKEKFAAYRDKGLDAKAAYAAANPDGIRSSVASSVKQKAQSSGKEHIKSVVPKGSKDNSGPTMTKAELAEWRDIFPGKSDKELLKLYRASKT